MIGKGTSLPDKLSIKGRCGDGCRFGRARYLPSQRAVAPHINSFRPWPLAHATIPACHVRLCAAATWSISVSKRRTSSFDGSKADIGLTFRRGCQHNRHPRNMLSTTTEPALAGWGVPDRLRAALGLQDKFITPRGELPMNLFEIEIPSLRLALLASGTLLVAAVVAVSARAETTNRDLWSITVDQEPPEDFVAAALEDLGPVISRPTQNNPNSLIAGNYGTVGDEASSDGIEFSRILDDFEIHSLPTVSLVLDWIIPTLPMELSPWIPNVVHIPPGDDEMIMSIAEDLWGEYFDMDSPRPNVPRAFVIENSGISHIEPIVRQLWSQNMLITSNGQPVGPGVYPLYVGPWRLFTPPTDVWAVQIAVVPEPASAMLLLMGLSTFVSTVRRQSLVRTRA